MDRVRVRLLPGADGAGTAGGRITVPAAFADRLGLTEDSLYRVRLARRETWVQFRSGLWAAAPQVALPLAMAETLGVHQPMELTAYVPEPGVVEFGPLVGALIAQTKLARFLAGKADPAICRYAQAAAETGAALIFLCAAGIEAGSSTVQGYSHRCRAGQPCLWEPVRCPLPPLIYDRCFGRAGREEAAQVRSVAEGLGARVVNAPARLSRLEVFAGLQADEELRPAIPATERLTPRTLARAMKQGSDLYLKPEYRDAGGPLYRLTRREKGWLVQSRSDEDSVEWLLPERPDLKVLVRQIGRNSPYMLQAGVPLADCLGSRFVLRALVQRDGQGRWVVAGLAARLARGDSPFTVHRGARWVLSPETALSLAFGDRWQEVLAAAELTALRLAEAADRQMGPCLELGLDLGVQPDGSLKLIDLSGKPLRRELEQLGDPRACERMDRYPVHCAAYWATREVGACTV